MESQPSMGVAIADAGVSVLPQESPPAAVNAGVEAPGATQNCASACSSSFGVGLRAPSQKYVQMTPPQMAPKKNWIRTSISKHTMKGHVGYVLFGSTD